MLPQTEQKCPAGGNRESAAGRDLGGDEGSRGTRGDAALRSPAERDGHRYRPGSRNPLQPARGLAAHPRALPSAQARRWDLQQSLQETPGPVICQEISALSDGQAGRVRLSACSFPRWALAVLERRCWKGRGWG